MNNVLILSMLLFVICFFQPDICRSAETGFNTIGVRSGFPATKKHAYFRQNEAFAVYGLPWDWHSVSGWGVSSQFEVTAGDLHSDGEDGFIGSAGPCASLDLFEKRLKFGLGINIHVLSRSVFGKQDFGSNLLFGAYVGTDVRIFDNIGVGYRLQHASLNKILYSGNPPNPGLDLHMFSVNWNF